MHTRISSKGQVVIPKADRQKLGWEAGTELIVEEAAGQVLLKPGPATNKTRSIRDVAGILHRPEMKPATLKQMDAAIQKGFDAKWR